MTGGALPFARPLEFLFPDGQEGLAVGKPCDRATMPQTAQFQLAHHHIAQQP
jgi:hypothetical protein